ncbi:hypothetical protein ABZ912_24230 [Nonomuraea angiospora]|uniref:hypothetical protein n=1 Tax=Nonomuraea angiospora TaxID=46172 RepID=UPI00340F28FB
MTCTLRLRIGGIAAIGSATSIGTANLIMAARLALARTAPAGPAATPGLWVWHDAVFTLNGTFGHRARRPVRGGPAREAAAPLGGHARLRGA